MHSLIGNSNGISKSLCCYVFRTQPGNLFASIQCRLLPASIVWWPASGVLHAINHAATIPSFPTSPLLSLPLPFPSLAFHPTIHNPTSLVIVWNEVDLFMLTGALIMGHWLINFKLSFLVSVLPFQLCKENSTFHINLLLLRILSHFSSSHERLRRKKRSRFEWYGKIWMRLALTCSAPIRKKIHF